SASESSCCVGDTVHTRTALPFDSMMSPMCGRRLRGAALRYCFSMPGTEVGPSANAIVSTLPLGERPWTPPFGANAAMKPTLAAAVVTPVKPCFVRHAFVAAAVYGLLDEPPHAARTRTRRAAASRGNRSTTRV